MVPCAWMGPNMEFILSVQIQSQRSIRCSFISSKFGKVGALRIIWMTLLPGATSTLMIRTLLITRLATTGADLSLFSVVSCLETVSLQHGPRLWLSLVMEALISVTLARLLRTKLLILEDPKMSKKLSTLWTKTIFWPIGTKLSLWESVTEDWLHWHGLIKLRPVLKEKSESWLMEESGKINFMKRPRRQSSRTE